MSEINQEQLVGLTDSHITWLTPSLGIHMDMLDAWQAMVSAAKQDGIDLSIASGFRSFERQLAIWNRKMTGNQPILDINEKPIIEQNMDAFERIQAIMLFSALPGASRHHWGTDIDVYAPSMLGEHQALKLEVSEYTEHGTFSRLTEWLNFHASRFGFYFPYHSYQGGVAAEPWHLSYRPLSTLFENNMSLENLHDVIKGSEIKEKAVILQNLAYLYNRFVASAFEAPPNN